MHDAGLLYIAWSNHIRNMVVTGLSNLSDPTM